MPPSTQQGPRVLYWFRTDLRLHDSPALAKALALKPSAFLPIFNWDPSYIYGHRVGINRFRFLLESLQDLSNEIKKLNSDSQLLLTRGAPQTRILELCERWQITHVAFEEDHNAYARRRDADVVQSLKAANIEVISEEGRHLYPIKEVLKHCKQPPTSMTQLQKAIAGLGDVALPAETPTTLPSPSPPGSDKADLKKLFELLGDLSAYKEEVGQPALDLNAAEVGGQRQAGPEGQVTSYDTVAAGEKSKYKEEKNPFAVPTLASLGMKEPEVQLAEPIRGGTTEALRRLEELTKDPSYLSTFAKPQTSPSTDPDAPSTTLLSPYIKFGCLGIRHFWNSVKETKKRHKGAQTSIPEGMEGQLLFRDMYAVCEAAVGDAFHGVRGNKISRYMDWYLPTVYDKAGKQIEPRPRGDDVSEERLRTFKEGQTGFPWIDALMRQLRMTGWIHHLGRHSVAAYLTRAQCWISWERGAEIFHEFLIDTDDASNDGNWMWLSASAFFSQYFRVYGLATFPAKYDKHAHIVRKYCPELKDFPDKYIYAPHTAPKEVQEKAKCIIGKDYPYPILDEKAEKKNCLARCKAAYDSKLYGTSKEVWEGKAEGILRKKHGIPDPKRLDYKVNTGNKIPAWARAGHECNPGLAKGGEVGREKDADDDDDDDELQGHEADHHDGDERGEDSNVEPGRQDVKTAVGDDADGSKLSGNASKRKASTAVSKEVSSPNKKKKEQKDVGTK